MTPGAMRIGPGLQGSTRGTAQKTAPTLARFCRWQGYETLAATS
jgi:hypothetical protein